MVTKLLIANRGEISCRAQRACNKLCLPYVAVYTEPDAMSLHVLKATESVCLGPSPKAYLDADRLIEVTLNTKCDAIFPGYGFLSENPEFAERCEAQGIVFIGPTPDTMRAFSRKHTARALASAAGVPILPGSDLLTTAEEAVTTAQTIGFPVLLKATGGGGGIGIHLCRTEAQVLESFASASRQGKSAFGDSGVFIEKYVENARHIEVQIFGDGQGTVVTFPERECSIQRRHQKVVEETPSPFVDGSPRLRQALREAARSLGEHVHYRSAGTVEFILDDDTGKFFFLEVNTRLQVEHGITEMVSGVDLVAWQLQAQGFAMSGGDVPSGTLLPFFKLPSCLKEFGHPEPRGHAIEVRLCAEDPTHEFRPCTGTLGLVKWPDSVAYPEDENNVRVDTWVETGSVVSAHYDSLLAKLMVYSDTNREDAIGRLTRALEQTVLGGVVTNLPLLRCIAASTPFHRGLTTTSFLQNYFSEGSISGLLVDCTIEVIDPGLMTTVQDWPGRTGLWSVGVPPSGPMDDASHRFANALVGNDSDAAALEITLMGPTLKFSASTVVAITGASVDSVLLNGSPAPQWTSFTVPAGGIVSIGACTDGARAYLAIGGGGLEVPEYLGSKSTFPAGKLGGHQGRALLAGDVLPLVNDKRFASHPCGVGVTVPEDWRPPFGEKMTTTMGTGSDDSEGTVWKVSVLPGPQEAPDYFTEEDVTTFYDTVFKVHHNSNRLGIRLEGPRPRFARTDGGEGGSHPSNVHDHVYAIGAINYTGDMPVVLTVDGPSLGGFVCPATIITNDLWKMGQVRPGDGVHFVACTIETALNQRVERDERVNYIRALAVQGSASTVSDDGYGGLHENPSTGQEPRFAGDNELDNNKFSNKTQTVFAIPQTTAVLWTLPASDTHPGAQVRLAGDRYLFLEYGPMELDLNLRVRVHQLEAWIKEHQKKSTMEQVNGIIETSPGVRSVMIEYDMRTLPLTKLLDLIRRAEAELPPASEIKLPTRVLHLPMAFDDKWTNEAISRYARSVRAEAPYVPSNISFIAANNGLDFEGDLAVRDIVFSASYMVLGLGDVYLGAPCAVPLDPRHRLVVPKYNPARTYTPEGGVGIGGCYMCIYGMDSPGGYQLVGRTLPIWNAFTRAGPFEAQKPWLLRNFDQVKYFQVSEEELEKMRSDFACGRLDIKIDHGVLDMKVYNRMVAEVAEEVREMKKRQATAMREQMLLDAEQLARIDSRKSMSSLNGKEAIKFGTSTTTATGKAITAAVSGTVWETKVEVGQQVSSGETLFVLEAMKMEYAVTAPAGGRIVEISVNTGELVQQGAALCLVGD